MKGITSSEFGNVATAMTPTRCGIQVLEHVIQAMRDHDRANHLDIEIVLLRK